MSLPALNPFLIGLQRWWLLALLFLIPLSLRYLTKEPFAISSLNVLSVGFIGLGVLNALLGFVPLRPIRHKPFLVLLACLLAAMAYALLFTDPLRNGIGLWTSRLLQPLLVGYFAFQLVENKRVKIEHCIQAIFYSLIPLLILGGMQLAGGLDYANPGRVTASYYQPNTFARYVTIVLLLALPWILFAVKKGKRLMLGIWILGAILLASTKSYGGTASFFFGLVALFALLPSPFLNLKRVVLLGLLVLAVLVAANAPRLPKWQTSITDSRLSRLEFWDIATHVIKDNYWTGIGIKTWETEYTRLIETYRTEPPLNWISVQPHNVYLDSFVKAGLPGFFAITALLLWPFFEGKAFARSFTKRHKDWWFGLSMAGYGVAMLVFGLIDDPIWSDDTMPLLFVLFFLLAAAVSRVSDNKVQKADAIATPASS